MPEHHAKTRVRLHRQTHLDKQMVFMKFGVFLCVHRLKISLIFNYVFFINYFLLHALLVGIFYCKIYHFAVTFANQKVCSAEKRKDIDGKSFFNTVIPLTILSDCKGDFS